MTPQTRAERVAALMLEQDEASRLLGLALSRVAPGEAEVTMSVSQAHLNGHGICHGGFIFTLADTAFALACNADNHVTVAQENQITFLSPGQRGEILTATATQVALQGRSGVFDVRVTGSDGRVVALMRGLSRRIRGQHFDESSAKETREA